MSVRLLSGSYLYGDTTRVFAGFPVVGAMSDADAIRRVRAVEPSATVDTVRQSGRMPRMDWASDDALELYRRVNDGFELIAGSAVPTLS